MADDFTSQKREYTGENGKFRAGNPGRPKGSKNKLQEDFFRDLASAWETHGIVALQQMLTEYPEKFVQTVAGLMPKDSTVEITQRSVMRMPEVAESSDEWKPSRNTTH